MTMNDGTMKDLTDLSERLTRYVAGDCTPEEARELSARLEREPAECELLAEILTQGLAIREFYQIQPEPARAMNRMPQRWLDSRSWRPLMTTAAGILFGMLCTSVVFGFVMPRIRLSSLLVDSFEGAPTLTSKVSLEPSVWRSNHAAIVGGELGVQPANGVKMLRFLHAGFDGHAKSQGDHLADAYHLLDLRPFRQEFVGEGCVVQVAASFNASLFPADEKYGCAVSVYALDAENAPDGPKRIGTALSEDSLAMARSRSTKLDREPDSWQRLTTELRLPANTDYIVVRLHISQSFDARGKPTFTGSYADDVRVSLTRRVLSP
jgi:hypothetical protein